MSSFGQPQYIGHDRIIGISPGKSYMDDIKPISIVAGAVGVLTYLPKEEMFYE